MLSRNRETHGNTNRISVGISASDYDHCKTKLFIVKEIEVKIGCTILSKFFVVLRWFIDNIECDFFDELRPITESTVVFE